MGGQAMKKNFSKIFLGLKKSLSISIHIDPNHIMVILKKKLDWNYLIEIVKKYRKKKIKNAAGPKPHLDILIGAIAVRILESCTLRKTMDFIQHYAPARYLCGLGFLRWTPNFRTISDFEIMLGIEGLQEINKYILTIAKNLGFADIKGVCADTTAQEANIPYPNEVGLMGAFARSIKSAVALLGSKIGSSKKNIIDRIGQIKKLVRKHRLFCKTKESKHEVEKKLFNITKIFCVEIKKMIKHMSTSAIQNLRGHQKTAYLRLEDLLAVFKKLSPQIAYYIQNGSAAKNKIISLFQPLLRAIVRGKAGKKVEFGIKWGINQIRGGYISLFFLDGKNGEADYAVRGVRHHIELFGEAPDEYGYDRGGWSEPHMEEIKNLGVKRIGIAPKGKANWKVSETCRKRISRERAQVEGKIGTIKGYDFNKPNAKTTEGMKRAAHRSELRFNLTKLTRDIMNV